MSLCRLLLTFSILFLVFLLTSCQTNEFVKNTEDETPTCSKDNRDHVDGCSKSFSISENLDVLPKNFEEEFKGHLKPFGESGSRKPVHTIQGFPSGDGVNFFQDYLLPNRPVLMKSAATQFPNFHKWTDKNLLRLSRHKKNRRIKVEVELRKKENRSGKAKVMKFHEFLKMYNRTNIYLVEKLLPWMEKISSMPCPLQCPQMDGVPLKATLWMSSGGTASVVHVDSLENIMCLYRGRKSFIMLDPATTNSGAILDEFESFSSLMDVEKVDLNRYPTLRGANFITADMEAGDCLYLPFLWIHQVRSSGSNLAINFWFPKDETIDLLKKGHCTGSDQICDPALTKSKKDYPNFETDYSSDHTGAEMRYIFEYVTVHGKGDSLSRYRPIKISEGKVKIDDFIQRAIYQKLRNYLGVENSTQLRSLEMEVDRYKDGEKTSTEGDGDFRHNKEGDDEWGREGQINREMEYLKTSIDGCRNILRQLDTDKDGTLTWAELEKGIHRFGAEIKELELSS